MSSKVREPIIVRALKNNIDEWSLYPGSTVLLRLKDRFSPLKTLIITRKSARLFETHELFVSEIPVEGVKEEDKPEVHVRLMGYEAELKWKGFFSNKPIFTHHSRLNKLSGFLPTLIIKDDLVKKLNEDTMLLETIKKVRPEEITITMMERFPPTKNVEEYIIRLRDYLENIDKVSWLIRADIYLDRAVKYVWRANAMIDIMKTIARYIKSISEKRSGSP